MTTLDNCPVCGSKSFSNFLRCKDFTVTKEYFDLVDCNECKFVFTNPRPADAELGCYYKSEDYISHSNVRKGVISWMYYLIRNFTLQQKVKLVSSYVSRGTILDYGCGTGMFLGATNSAGWQSFGLEPDAGARTIAATMTKGVYENKHALASEQPKMMFDAITLWHVLEHVTDLQETLGFFKSRLNRDGALIVAVPNHKSFDAEHYKEYWAAYDVPRHLYHFDITSISKLLRRQGFTLIDTRPMKFDSFYVSILSEKYKRKSISYGRAFLNGLRSNARAQNTGEYSSRIYVFKHHKTHDPDL